MPAALEGRTGILFAMLLCTCAIMDMYITCIAFIEIAPRRGAISILQRFHVHDQAFCLTFSHRDY